MAAVRATQTVQRLALVLSFALGPSIHAQSPQAQSPIPIVETSTPAAVSKEVFGTILNVRALAGGDVLLNDGLRRRLVILDNKLVTKALLLDSATIGAQSYGPRASPLIGYLGDSTVFVDGAASSLVVIDPTGHIARTMAAPQARDLRFLSSSASGVDANGNLIYRVALFTPPQRPMKPGDPTVITAPDSAAIVRANFSTRKVDTIGRVKINNGTRTESIRDDAGATVSSKFVINPIDVFDEWAVLSNGDIALVRGHDYHIDWIGADGKHWSTSKMPFDLLALSDGDKQQIVDSVRTVQEKQLDESVAVAKQGTLGGAPDGPRNQIVRPQVTFVPLDAMSNYRSPLRPGAVKADLDGHLWILPTTSKASRAGELVYDVINDRGELFERVRLPAQRFIAGFGHGGIVYLTTKDATGWRLERVTLTK